MNKSDYGNFLGKEGVIIAGGALYSGDRKWLVHFSDPEYDLNVFGEDLEMFES